jgi:hypothetical protein
LPAAGLFGCGLLATFPFKGALAVCLFELKDEVELDDSALIFANGFTNAGFGEVCGVGA